MSQINVSVDTLPPGALVFQTSFSDVAGVVAANNFASIFNPVASGKTVVYLGLVLQSYTTGNVSVGASMRLVRTTAASGGSLLAASSITKFDTTQRNSIAEWRTGNPTVTAVGIDLLAVASVQAASGGSTNPALVAAFGGAPTSHPGEGVVFTTASGSTMQMWNLQLTWTEF